MKHTDFAIETVREQLIGMVNCSRLRTGERNAVFEAAEIIGQLVKERNEVRKALEETVSPSVPSGEILIAPDGKNEWRRMWKTEIYFESEAERDLFDRKLADGWVVLDWCRTENELPSKEGTWILCAVTGKYGNLEFDNALLIGEWDEDEGWVLDSYPEIENPNVTHWIELPEPPAKEEGEPWHR